eukprot:6774497-Pyramimonas_sp.AAC.1
MAQLGLNGQFWGLELAISGSRPLLSQPLCLGIPFPDPATFLRVKRKPYPTSGRSRHNQMGGEPNSSAVKRLIIN